LGLKSCAYRTKLRVPLAVAVVAPLIVTILVFHALMAPSGLRLALFAAYFGQ
jgi:hypothetical protein